MILREFASNQPYVLISVPLVVLGILMPSLWLPSIAIVQADFPVDSLFEVFYSSPKGAIIGAMLLITGGSFISNAVFNRHEFFNVPSYVPALMYAVIGGTMTLYQLSIPALVASIFVLLGLNKQMQIFRQTRVLSESFEAGFWYGMAAVCFPPFICLLAGAWIAILITRAFNWREHLLLLLSFSVPFIYWIVWKYWIDELNDLILFRKIVSYDGPELSFIKPWTDQLFLLTVAVAFVFAIPRYLFLKDRISNKAGSVKNIFFSIALSLIASFVMSYFLVSQWILLTTLVPVTFIVGYWFTNYRYSLVAPFVFYGLMLSCVLSVLFHYGVF